MALSRNPATDRVGARGCCTIEDSRDARRAADLLGIPFYVWDLSERFQAEVVEDFLTEYAAGRTPNPCVRCNERIKFAALLDKALALDFDAVCTGHYARLVEDVEGTAGATGTVQGLHRAVDQGKDQSYVLAVLTPEQLSHSMFPLGDVTKDEVRAEAARRGLAVAAKPDSHDICFIPDGDTRAWLGARIPRRPGAIVDLAGAVVGEHDGAVGYTVGQRRGLRLGIPAADGAPRYVVGIEPETNTVVVGPRRALDREELLAGDPIWCGPVAPPGSRVGVQIRAHGEEVPGVVLAVGDEIRVRLEQPIAGIAAGQTMVLYTGDRAVCAAVLR
jgi:tRNA-specific 2-thiouridylase